MNDIRFKIDIQANTYFPFAVYEAEASWMPWRVDGFRWKYLKRFDTIEGAERFIRQAGKTPMYFTTHGNATTFDTEED